MSSASVLSSLAGMLASGGIEVVDCSGVLGPETPLLKLPPDFVAYHQPDCSGHLNPRRLVEAQKILAAKFGAQG